MTLRNMLTACVSHGVHIVHAWTTEIKEYDVKAHRYGMVALRKTYGR